MDVIKGENLHPFQPQWKYCSHNLEDKGCKYIKRIIHVSKKDKCSLKTRPNLINPGYGSFGVCNIGACGGGNLVKMVLCCGDCCK